MTRIPHHTLLFAFGLLAGADAKAQSPCADRIKDAFLQMQKDLERTPQRALQSEMLITTVFTDPEKPTTRERVMAASANDRSLFENGHFVLTEDTKHKVVVLSLDSSIQIYDQLDPEKPISYTPYMESLGSTLARASSLTCRTMGLDNAGTFLVTMDLGHVNEGISRIEISFDPQRRYPRTIIAHYLRGHELSLKRTDILSYQLGRLDARLNVPVVELVMNGDELQPAYEGFELTDHRLTPTQHVD
jgi:hypothetical protein